MSSTHDFREIFNTLSSKITQLSLARSKNDRNVINSTLSELNSFNYKYPIVTNPAKAVLLVNQCCTLIPPEDLESVLKCCQLITNLITRQNVIIDGRTQTVAVLWCLQSLRGQSTDADVLTALDALLRGSIGHDLIGEVTKNEHVLSFAKSDKTVEITYAALQCLEACTIPLENAKVTNTDKFSHEFEMCFEIFLEKITRGSLGVDKLISVKTYITCLRGLQNILRQRHDLVVDKLGVILGVIKSYMLLGISGIEFVKPQKLMASPLSVPECTEVHMTREKGGKMTKHRRPKTQATVMKVRKSEKWDDSGGSFTTPVVNTYPEDGYNSFGNSVKTSDSDFSDTEGGNAAKLVVTTGRVRQAALSLFVHVVKMTDRTAIFSFWSSFIPDNPMTNKHHLITCILKETSNRGRMTALNALLILLSTCKLYLAQAEKGDNLAFTPFSVTLGLTITELHKCLSLALTAPSTPIITVTLKCFSALVQATPYHRLSQGLITKVIRNVKPYVFHKDATVQVTALMVLGCVLASEPLIQETKDVFLRNIETKKERKIPQEKPDDFVDFAEFSSDEDEAATVSKYEIPWLLDRCIFNLNSETVPAPVKIESLQIISAISRNYFESLLIPFLSVVTKTLDVSLFRKAADVQLHAGKAVDFIGQAITRCLSTEDCGLTISQSLAFWQTLLNNSLPALFQSEQSLLRAVGCDCLASIGSQIFEQLPRDKQILCVTLLFSCTQDDEYCAKGSAVRGLAIYVLYPSLKEDPGFVVDTSDAVYRVLLDDTFVVRVKSSWALGNLCEALVMNKDLEHFMEEFPDSLVLKLLKITIKVSGDSDRIKMNTMRALGNLLQMIDANFLEEKEFRDAAEEGLHILVKNCTSGSNMKVRWNSCHAIGNVMKNPALFTLPTNWKEKIFNALTELVINFRNFKVRINAAAALATPKTREFYKQYYQQVWVALIKGLETSQNMEDFTEYKHRDTLIEQICLTLGHLMTLLTKEDILVLKDSILSDYLHLQMKRIWEKLLPEKSTVLFEAQTYVTELKSRPDLSSEQKTILQSLQDILTHQF